MDAELSDTGTGRVKKLRRLARRASREEARQFLVEGAQSVREALAAHKAGEVVVRELLVRSRPSGKPELLASEAAHVSIRVTTASDAVMDALSETVTPQGIVAVVDFLDVPLESVLASAPSLVVVLSDVRDPGNAGSVVRAADAAGADAVVFAGDTVDPYNGKAVRASVGGLFHLPIVTGVSTEVAIDALRTAGLRILATDAAAGLSLDAPEVEERLGADTAWIFGNESWGVTDEVVRLADAAVSIPIYGRAESLNLATAAALCLYASADAQRRQNNP